MGVKFTKLLLKGLIMESEDDLFQDDSIAPEEVSFFKSDAAKLKILESKIKASEKRKVEDTQLPLWSFDRYGVPRSMVRCSLFGSNSIINISEEELKDSKNLNKYQTKKTLESLSNYKIQYTGYTLNQEILDVFMTVIDMHSKKKLHIGEESVSFTGYEILKNLSSAGSGFGGGSGYARLKFYLTLLQSGNINIECFDKAKNKTAGFTGSLIRKYEYELDHGSNKSVFKVWFEPEILNLFKDGITEMYKDQREKLGRRQLAKWLLAFYASHTSAFDYDIETIYRLSGSGIKSMHKFKQKLNESINALINVGLLNCPKVVGNKLVVTKVLPRAR